MTAKTWLLLMLATTAAIYSATALAYHVSLRPGMTLVFVGYAIANLGLIWDAAAQ